MNVQQSKFRLSRWAGATLALGLLLSGLGAWGLALVNEQQARMALEREAELLAEAVTRRVELYQYGLRGVRGALLTAGEAHIDRELFRRYSLTRDIDREFPGARGFGFIRRVAAADEAGFLRQARADGQPEFRIQQLTPHDGERYVIQYIEPVARNGQALGLDIASEANRREAARAALETGQVRLTGPITLVQASGLRQQSFLILMPIYRSGITPPPGPQRELEGFGWSYAPLLTGEVLAGLPIDNAAIHLELSDVTGDGAAVPFFVNGAAAPAQRLFGHMLRREIYGRHWQMAFSALPLFVQRLHQPSPRILFLAGSLVSLLLAALVNASALGRQRRHREAATQARLAAIVGNSADGIIGVGLDGVISDWNRGAEALFGYREEQAVGRRVVDLLVPPSKENEELDILARIARKEQVVSFDTVRRHQDGHLLDVAVTVSPILGPDGGVVGASKTVRDISAKKAAEARIRELNTGLEHQIAERTAELRRLNVLLGSVLQAASEVSIITLDRDGIISGFNLGAERMLGYRADEVVGKASPTLLHSERELLARGQELGEEGFRVLVARAEQEGAETREWTYLRKDGSPLSVTLSVTVLRDEAGAINGYLGIAVDVTEWRNAEREMAAAHDQLQMAADVARLGIWRWNLADDSLQWNERMCELYGQPLALRDGGLVYEHWRSRLHPEDLERTEASLRAAVEGRGNYDVIFRVVLPDGGIRFIQAGAQVERDADGNPLQVTGINIDITSDQQLQARLREAKEQADAASAAKSSFLANMSHEIRTPMNAVLGMLQLARQTDLNERQRDYLDKASSAATSLLGLLNDILDYSKIEAGKLVLEMLPFELEPLMQDLAVVLSGNQGDKDVEVIFDIDPELPSAVVGDRLRLQQILINLAGNALKFTARGHVLVSLRRLAHDAHLVRLRVLVADTGIGISAEQQQRIFEGFTQAEASTSRRFGGTGLGLFICKRLVDLMGGELRVESAPGSGSRFWFDLDLDVAHDQPLRAACPGAGEPLRLLVADDNLVAGELLERTVGALGWRADCVGSGSEAVARVQAAMAEGRRYDVVLMDWRMPDLDGLSAAQLIRQLQGDLPPPMVIMITAYGREVLADARDHSAPPFVDFLTKPVTPKQLADSVLHALHGEQGAPANPPPRPVERTQRLRGVRLLVVEDNALNRQVAAELLSSEGARVALADGGLAGVQQVLEASVPFDAVLMDMQMPDIDGLEATRRIRADGRFAGLPILAMTANASLADREACLAAGMNDHVAKPIDKERLVLCLLGHLGRSGARGAPATAADAGELVEARGDIVGRFGGSLELIVQVLRRFVPDMQDLFAQLERQLGEGDVQGSAATLHTIKGSASTVGASALAGRASELEQALRRADPRRGMEILAGIRLDELRTLCDACLLRLQAMFGDVQAESAS
ncbi:CHASE domain-containing protein [Pseudomonas aeruginosa]